MTVHVGALRYKDIMSDNLLTRIRKRSLKKQKRENCKKGSFLAKKGELASFSAGQELRRLTLCFHRGQYCRNEENFVNSRKAVPLLVVVSHLSG